MLSSGLFDLIAELIAELDLPRSLREIGIAADHLDDIAHRALAYEAVRMNPRRIDGPADVKEILALA